MYYLILLNFNPSSLLTLDTLSVNHITDEKKNYEDILWRPYKITARFFSQNIWHAMYVYLAI